MAKREYKTKSRKLIIDYLIQSKDRTASIADIKAYFESCQEQVNVSTIYRNLDKLVSDGTVLKYQNEDGKKAVFQYVDDSHGPHGCHEHLHMQCVKCGRMIHLNCGFMDQIRGHMMEHHHFMLQCENSVLYGMCENCQ